MIYLSNFHPDLLAETKRACYEFEVMFNEPTFIHPYPMPPHLDPSSPYKPELATGLYSVGLYSENNKTKFLNMLIEGWSV